MGEFTDRAVTIGADIHTLGLEADAQVAALSTIVHTQEVRIDELEAELEQYKPKYEVSIGYCPDPNTANEVVRLGEYSGAWVRRSYKAPGNFPGSPTFLQDAPAGLRTAHTIKGPGGSMADRINRMLTDDDRSTWKNYLKKLAPKSIVGCEHEPENDPITKTLWKSGQVWFGGVVDEVNDEFGLELVKSGNLMSSTDSESQIDAWYPGDGVWDILGFDGYNWPNRNPGSATIPRWVEFEEIFTPDWEQTQRLGLKFAIFEFGCRKADLYDEVNNMELPDKGFTEKQEDWCRKARIVMEEKFKPEVACYFHHNWWLMRPRGHRALGAI